MNFSISKEKFARLLYLTNTIVKQKNTMPILANVLLTAADGKLGVAASDLEVSLIGEAPADVKTPGKITVAARMLYDIVKELPADNVNVQVTKGQRVEIQSGQSCFKIVGASADEFPSLTGVTLEKPISVEAGKLAEMIEKTSYAVSTDETRYNINGVYVETVNHPVGKESSGIRFVATDGHRLSMIDRPAEGFTIDKGVIIPRKGIAELKKNLEGNEGAASVCIKEGFFTVQTGSVTVGIRLVDGEYPDYRQVIPVNNATVVSIARDELLAAVRRVSLVSTDKTKAIKFRVVENNMILSSSSPEYGEASESLEIKKTGDDVAIGFSSNYVSDLLSSMNGAELVEIKFSGELGPAVFSANEDEFYQCIVMPMRFE